jgi:hypothetical protein
VTRLELFAGIGVDLLCGMRACLNFPIDQSYASVLREAHVRISEKYKSICQGSAGHKGIKHSFSYRFEILHIC